VNFDEPSNANFLRRAGYWIIGGSAVHALIQSSSLGSGKRPVQSVFFGVLMAVFSAAGRYWKAPWRAVVYPVHAIGLGMLGLAMLVFAMMQRPTDIGSFALWEWAFVLRLGSIPGFLVVAGAIELRRRVREIDSGSRAS
jgi:hypothetical protein